jgi:hypothetical protein
MHAQPIKKKDAPKDNDSNRKYHYSRVLGGKVTD